MGVVKEAFLEEVVPQLGQASREAKPQEDKNLYVLLM